MPAAYPQILARQLLPMLATSAEPFDDPGCLFQVKWDGVRALAVVEADGVRLWGREGSNYSGRYPELDVLRRLPAGTVLDGELVMLRDGLPDFHGLMARHARRPSRLPYRLEPITYVVFDLLYLGGQSLLDRPLCERRDMLHETLPRSPCVAACEGVVGKGKSFFKKILAAGHEGLVAKRLSSRYVANQRGRAWQKIKQKLAMPCVVIGCHLGRDGLRDLVMASLVDGKLAYVGTVELGIDGRPETIDRLESLRIPRPAVPCSLSARWVRPELLCVVQFCGWRPGGWWRDAIFQGWAE